MSCGTTSTPPRRRSAALKPPVGVPQLALLLPLWLCGQGASSPSMAISSTKTRSGLAWSTAARRMRFIRFRGEHWRARSQALSISGVATQTTWSNPHCGTMRPESGFFRGLLLDITEQTSLDNLRFAHLELGAHGNFCPLAPTVFYEQDERRARVTATRPRVPLFPRDVCAVQHGLPVLRPQNEMLLQVLCKVTRHWKDRVCKMPTNDDMHYTLDVQGYASVCRYALSQLLLFDHDNWDDREHDPRARRGAL